MSLYVWHLEVTCRYMSESVRSNRYCALRPNTAMKLGLVEALLKEQEEALSTAQRCQTQIARLVKEQAQLQVCSKAQITKAKGIKKTLHRCQKNQAMKNSSKLYTSTNRTQWGNSSHRQQHTT